MRIILACTLYLAPPAAAGKSAMYVVNGDMRCSGKKSRECDKFKMTCMNGERRVVFRKTETYGTDKNPSVSRTTVGHCGDNADYITADFKRESTNNSNDTYPLSRSNDLSWDGPTDNRCGQVKKPGCFVRCPNGTIRPAVFVEDWARDQESNPYSRKYTTADCPMEEKNEGARESTSDGKRYEGVDAERDASAAPVPRPPGQAAALGATLGSSLGAALGAGDLGKSVYQTAPDLLCDGKRSSMCDKYKTTCKAGLPKHKIVFLKGATYGNTTRMSVFKVAVSHCSDDGDYITADFQPEGKVAGKTFNSKMYPLDKSLQWRPSHDNACGNRKRPGCFVWCPDDNIAPAVYVKEWARDQESKPYSRKYTTAYCPDEGVQEKEKNSNQENESDSERAAAGELVDSRDLDQDLPSQPPTDQPSPPLAEKKRVGKVGSAHTRDDLDSASYSYGELVASVGLDQDLPSQPPTDQPSPPLAEKKRVGKVGSAHTRDDLDSASYSYGNNGEQYRKYNISVGGPAPDISHSPPPQNVNNRILGRHQHPGRPATPQQ